MILRGEKTVTWRLFDDKDLSIGDKVEFLNWETGELFAYTTITSCVQKTLGNLQPHDFNGHRTFSSPNEMYEHYATLYQRKVDESTPLKILTFELLHTPT